MPTWPTQSESVLAHHGLRPVWRSFFGHFALSQDNEVYFLPDYALSPHEPAGPPEVVEDAHARRVTFIWAALRYPELAHLMPRRGASDVTCPDCDGSGLMTRSSLELAAEGYPCWCLGIGWWPDGRCLLGFD
jgi:hypothetical protein